MTKSNRTTVKGNESEVEAPTEDVTEPFLPPLSTHPYTLVVDLDETLVHYAEVKLK